MSVNNEPVYSKLRSRIRQVQKRLDKYSKPGRPISDERIAERRDEAKRDEEPQLKP